MNASAQHKTCPAEFQRKVEAKRRARMDHIDAMQPELRELVNAYGYNVVKAFLDSGVTKHRNIKHLVETVLDEFSPTRGCYSMQGIRTQIDA